MRSSTTIVTRAASVLALVLAVSAEPAPPPALVRPADIVAHLARTISWYRNLSAAEHTDALLGDSIRRNSTRALQLAFDFARAGAALAGDQRPDAGGTGGGRTLDQAAARAVERLAAIEKQIAEVDASLDRAGARRPALIARRRELAAELNLAKQIQETVQGLRTFLSGQGAGSGSLPSYIERLERSVPEAMRGAQPASAPAAARAGERAFHPESAGIFSLAMEVIRTRSGRHQLLGAVSESDTLLKNIDQLRAPLAEALRSAIRRSDAAAGNSAGQTAEQMEADRREIEALTAQFKHISAALVPLREQGMLVETTRGSLLEWRDGMERQAGAAARYLLLRVAVLAGAILALLGISELWRRGTFRYVRDARRRRQFLVLRRVIVSCAIVLAVVLGLVNELGSLATYAGFLTAGLAVALQNVILSIVAYFFLIGRYGLRVGDRVTISGVTGDVLDIGLVRIYVMEMAGAGADMHATGRVVVFSNSVLFQPAALFKQMPGTDYVWHTAALTLAPDSDFETAERRLMEAVEAVYEQYRERIEQQHAAFQRLVDVPVSVPRPQGRLRFTEQGLEFTVRYPVELRHGSTTDDQVLKALRDAVGREPALAPAGGSAPKLQEAR